MSTFNDKTWTQWFGFVVRLALGAAFIYAAMIKLLHLGESKMSVVAYHLFPIPVAQFLGVALPVIELALGILLVVGLFTRLVAICIGLLLVVYIAGIISAWARGLSISCGCFSPGGVVDHAAAVAGYKKDIARDTLMILGAAWLALWPRTPLSVDRWLKVAPSEL